MNNAPQRTTVEKPLPAVSYIPQEGKDFRVYNLYGLFHWESMGPVYGDKYCNEEGFVLPSNAIADAASFLSAINPEEAIP